MCCFFSVHFIINFLDKRTAAYVHLRKGLLLVTKNEVCLTKFGSEFFTFNYLFISVTMWLNSQIIIFVIYLRLLYYQQQRVHRIVSFK